MAESPLHLEHEHFKDFSCSVLKHSYCCETVRISLSQPLLERQHEKVSHYLMYPFKDSYEVCDDSAWISVVNFFIHIYRRQANIFSLFTGNDCIIVEIYIEVFYVIRKSKLLVRKSDTKSFEHPAPKSPKAF